MLCEEEAGGSEKHEMNSDAIRALSDQYVDDKAQPIVSQVEGMTFTSPSALSRDNYFIGSGEMNVDQSQPANVYGTSRDAPTQPGESPIQAGAQSPVVPGPRNDTPVPESNEERPKIRDFDRSANELWTLFGTEAKSHDNARVNTLKDDMDGVLIFVCSYLSVPIYVLMRDPTGWFIFCCPHGVRNR
jgi:hypothetical protein